MTSQVYGPQSRRPVYSGKHRVPGLYERSLASGGTVFEARIRLGGTVERHRLSAITKTDAISELRTLQVDHARGEQHRSKALGVTVAELAADFHEHMKSRINDIDPRRRRSSRTVSHYNDQLRLHVIPVLGQKLAADVTVADVRRLLDKAAAKKLSPSSRTGLLTILSALMRFGVKAGVVERNPVRDLDRDDRPGAGRLTEPRYLSADEVVLLLSKMGDTFRPVAACAAYAGLRVSEVLGLRWSDVDLKSCTLSVSAQLKPDGERGPLKTAASAATVPILPVLNAELTAHRSRVAAKDLQRTRRDAYVFTTKTGKSQSARNVLRAVYEAGDDAKLNRPGLEPVGVHDLRHSCIAIALAAGMTLPEAAAVARHANPRVTATTYAGLTEENRSQIASKLAEAFGA